MLQVILGPTAVGKTAYAVERALADKAEIISADSRQVFRGMDLGTGKDLADYVVDGHPIATHLIDIREAGDVYSVYDFYHDFHRVYADLQARAVPAILCGGTGLYLDAVLRDYDLRKVPENPALRQRLAGWTENALQTYLGDLKTMHNVSDFRDRETTLRAIEIALFQQENPRATPNPLNFRVTALRCPRTTLCERISKRLKQRLDAGMIDEVETLLQRGVKAEQLIAYGLEYKYLTWMLQGQLSYDAMFDQLNTAIQQFAKRQMTWFRGMERKGVPMTWVDRN